MAHNSFGVLTLNLWNIRPPLEKRLNGLARFLSSARPEFVCLQEVSLVRGIAESSIVASKAGYEFQWFEEAGAWEGRREGLAILSHRAMEVIGTTKLPEVPDDTLRILQRVRAEVDDDGHKVEFANTHLASRLDGDKYRMSQANAIVEALVSDHNRFGLPIVLCGDFNDEPSSSSVQLILDNPLMKFIDVWALKHPGRFEHTFAAENPWADPKLLPGRRIDYVFLDEGLDVGSCEIVLNGRDGHHIVSDHYGILARFELPSSVHR